MTLDEKQKKIYDFRCMGIIACERMNAYKA